MAEDQNQNQGQARVEEIQKTLNNYTVENLKNSEEKGNWSFPIGLNPLDNTEKTTEIIDIDKYWNFNNVVSPRIDVEFLEKINNGVAKWININKSNVEVTSFDRATKVPATNNNNYIVSMNITDNGVKELDLVLYDRNFTDLQKLITNSIQVINEDQNLKKSHESKIQVKGAGEIKLLASPQKVTANIRVRYGYNEDLNSKVNKDYSGLGVINKENSEGKYYRWRSSTSAENINKLENATQENIQDISSDTVLSHHYQQSTVLSEWEEFFITGLTTNLTESGIKYNIKGISTSKMALDGYKMMQQYSKIVGKPKTILSTFMNTFNGDADSPIKLVWADKSVSASDSTINGEELVLDYETGKYMLINEDKKEEMIENITIPINDISTYIKALLDLKACFKRNPNNTISDYANGYDIEYSKGINYIEKQATMAKIKLQKESFIDIAAIIYNSNNNKKYTEAADPSFINDFEKSSCYMYALINNFGTLMELNTNKDSMSDESTIIYSRNLLKMWLAIIATKIYDGIDDYSSFSEFSKKKNDYNKLKSLVDSMFYKLCGEMNIDDMANNQSSDNFFDHIPGEYKEIAINEMLSDLKFQILTYDNTSESIYNNYTIVDLERKEITDKEKIDYASLINSTGTESGETLIYIYNNGDHILNIYGTANKIGSIHNINKKFENKLSIYEMLMYNNHYSNILSNENSKELLKTFMDGKGAYYITDLLSSIEKMYLKIFSEKYEYLCNIYANDEENNITKNFSKLKNSFLEQIKTYINNPEYYTSDSGNSDYYCLPKNSISYDNGKYINNLTENYHCKIENGAAGKVNIKIIIENTIPGSASDSAYAYLILPSDFVTEKLEIKEENKEYIKRIVIYINNVLNFVSSYSSSSTEKSTINDKNLLYKTFCKEIFIKEKEVFQVLDCYKMHNQFGKDVTYGGTSENDKVFTKSVNSEYYLFLKELGTKIIKNRSSIKENDKTLNDTFESMKTIEESVKKETKKYESGKLLDKVSEIKKDIENNFPKEKINFKKMAIKELEGDTKNKTKEEISNMKENENSFEPFGKKIFQKAFTAVSGGLSFIDISNLLNDVDKKVEELNATLQNLNKKLIKINNSNVGKEIELSLGSQESANPNNHLTKSLSSLLNDFCSQCQPKISALEKRARGLEENGEAIKETVKENGEETKKEVIVKKPTMIDQSSGEEKEIDIHNNIPRYNLTWGIVGKYKGSIPVVGLYYKEPIKVSKLRKYNWGPGNAKMHCIKNLSISNGSEFALMHNFNTATIGNDNNMLISLTNEDVVMEASTSDKILESTCFFNQVFNSERDKDTFNNLLNSVNQGNITLLGDPSLRFGGVVQPYTYPIYLNINLDRENSWHFSKKENKNEYYNEVSQLSGYYVITKITHNISTSGFTTTIEVMKYPGSSNLLKSK